MAGRRSGRRAAGGKTQTSASSLFSLSLSVYVCVRAFCSNFMMNVFSSFNCWNAVRPQLDCRGGPDPARRLGGIWRPTERPHSCTLTLSSLLCTLSHREQICGRLDTRAPQEVALRLVQLSLLSQELYEEMYPKPVTTLSIFFFFLWLLHTFIEPARSFEEEVKSTAQEKAEGAFCPPPDLPRRRGSDSVGERRRRSGEEQRGEQRQTARSSREEAEEA